MLFGNLVLLHTFRYNAQTCIDHEWPNHLAWTTRYEIDGTGLHPCVSLIKPKWIMLLGLIMLTLKKFPFAACLDFITSEPIHLYPESLGFSDGFPWVAFYEFDDAKLQSCAQPNNPTTVVHTGLFILLLELWAVYSISTLTMASAHMSS